MCGITGFLLPKNNLHNIHEKTEILTRMCDEIYHRGPDNHGVYIDKNVFLGHRRLSIRDIEKGSQPMTRVYKGISATIIYNGELYNTDELINMLRPYKINFESTSDTEILLYAFIVFGPSIFSKLNGIFAFCIYSDNKLYLARDHFGVKPLYYYHNEDAFVFASEIKSIFKYGIKPEITKEGLQEIFVIGPAHTPGKSIYKNIHQLLPGHYLCVNANNEQICYTSNCYWSLTAYEHTDNYNQTVEKVAYLLEDSIKRQLVSDVPICTFLSGGLDSSLVSAICNKHMNLSGQQLDTYSFDFKDNNKNFISSEYQSTLDRPYVDIMVNHINSNHRYLECNSDEQYKYLYTAVDARDMPCMADIESSLMYFCKQVSFNHKVVLTGECADEIFGGYPWFHLENLINHNSFPWSINASFRKTLLKDEFAYYLDMENYEMQIYENSVSQTPSLYTESGTNLKLRQIAWLNLQWFMQTLLARMDGTSMYYGLEARVPFCDYRLIQYVYNVPWEIKSKNGIRKNLLIEAGKDFLPKEVLYRKKSPYPKTYDKGYEQILGSRILEILHNANNPIANICDIDKVSKYVNSPKDYGKPWYGQLMAGPQLLAYMLQVEYTLRKYNISI